MMNLTVLSLISTSLISHSPAFVNNHLSLSECNFQKFTTLIFYNQKSLHLQSSSFKKGRSGIIHIESNDHIRNLVQDDESKTFKNETYREQLEIPKQKMSVTIMQCLFDGVKTFGLSTPHVIFVNEVDRSIYITDTTFNDCSSNSGILYLQSCRCLTMTHTCCFHSECDNRYSFFYYDCKDEDFFVFLYSTIVSSKVSSAQDKSSIANTFCKNGDQYYKCLNMTDCPYKGFEFDSPNCFSFAFNTIMNCDYYSFVYTGNYNKEYLDKEVERCNIYGSDNAQTATIYLDSNDQFTLTFAECAILSNDKGIYFYSDIGMKIKLVFQSCILSQEINEEGVDVISPVVKNHDSKHLTLHPHLTNTHCPGIEVEDKESALACNADQCMDTLCNRTIGFPDGVIPYTTIHHKDIQTDPPTPTQLPDQTPTQLPDQTPTKLPDQTETPTPEQTEIVTASYNISEEPILPGDSAVIGEKNGTDWSKIGIIIGCTVAGAAIIALVAFFLIKKFKRIPIISNQLDEINDSAITYENSLQNVREDDPFADEF